VLRNVAWCCFGCSHRRAVGHGISIGQVVVEHKGAAADGVFLAGKPRSIKGLHMPQVPKGYRITRFSGPTFCGGCPLLAGRTDLRDSKDVSQTKTDLANVRTEMNDEKAFQISDASYPLQNSCGVYDCLDGLGWSQT